MAKNEPVLTHTEILCLAIRQLQSDIEDIKRRGESLAEKTGNKEMANDIVAKLIAPITPKLEAIKEMYHIETGSNFE